MQIVLKPKEALHWGASFGLGRIKYLLAGKRYDLFCCLLVISINNVSAALASEACRADHIDEYVRVAHIYDGDTLRLEDGRRIRLIGVNTPELGRDDRPTEPYAQEAYDALKKLMASSARIGLRFDKERHDRYQRVLAHLYTEDHHSIEAWMLEQGYGAQIVEPPNLWNRECYEAAEKRARSGNKGIWALPHFQPLETAALPSGTQGFRLIKGRVDKVTETNKAIMLELDGGFVLRIDRSDLTHFGDFQPLRWNNKLVDARGWIYQYKNSLRMRIRHPDTLQVLE